MSPKVSVIIPVYNAERHFSECLEAVLSQTLKDIEIIIVDDGSTDSSLAIAKQYAKSDNRIKVLAQENRNAGAARNLGLASAKGEYLSFLDSDDFFDGRMLEKGYAAAKEKQAQIAVWRTQRYIEDTGSFESAKWTVKEKYLPGKEVFSADEVKQNLFLAFMGYTWDKLFLRSFIEEHGVRFQSQPVFNDALFTFTALWNARRIVFVDETLVTQRKRSAKDSISDRRARYWTCSYTLLDGMQRRMQQDGLYDRYRQDFVNYAVHLLLLDLETKSGENRAKMEEAIKRYWAKDLEISSHLSDESYFYNQEQRDAFREVLYGPLKHSSLELRKDLGRESSAESLAPATVQIAFSTDANYAYPTAVALASLLERATSTTRYEIYVLVNDAFPESSRRVIEEVQGLHPGHSLEFVTPQVDYNEANICIDHITTATYYRLSLASLLPHVDKCIYLDSDIIVRDDLRSLFDIDLGDDLLAGVRAYAYFRSEGMARRKMQELQVDSWDIYVNAGVLLLNLKAIREEGLEGVFASLLERNFSSQDQDILNLACRGRIKLLPFKYTVMTKYDVYSSSLHENSYLKDWVSAEEWDEGRSLPTVIHYADRRKPWTDMSSLYAEAWWDVERRLPDGFQLEIFQTYMYDLIESASENNAQFYQMAEQQRRLSSYLRFWVRKKAGSIKRRLKRLISRKSVQ